MPGSCNVVDFAVGLLLAVLTLLLEFDAIPTLERMFFVDDLDISYPLKPQSVPTSTLIMVSFGIPIVLVLVLELAVPARRRPIQFVVTRITWLLAGIFFTTMTTSLAKKAAGRLRPNFLARCHVDPAKLRAALATHAGAYPLNGTGSLGLVTRTAFSAAEVCRTPVDSPELNEGRLSFPSGHASLSAYAGVFAALYLQQAVRTPAGTSALAVPLAQLVCVSWGVVVGLTRYSDAFHHGTDVLAGAAIGAAVAWYVYRRLLLPRPAPEGAGWPDRAEDEAGSPLVGTLERESPFLKAGVSEDDQPGAAAGAARRRGAGGTVADPAALHSHVRLSLRAQGAGPEDDTLAWEPSQCGTCLLVRRLTPQELAEAGRWCKFSVPNAAATDADAATAAAAAPGAEQESHGATAPVASEPAASAGKADA